MFTFTINHQDEKKEIVDVHNKLRSRIAKGLETNSKNGKPQPKAANMKKISWDEGLAETAHA